MSELTFVESDGAPSISGTLTDQEGLPFDLTDAVVRFQMRLIVDRRWKVDAVAGIVSAINGTVVYDWLPGDLNTAGEYQARWQITFPDDTIQHTDPANTITVAAQ